MQYKWLQKQFKVVQVIIMLQQNTIQPYPF